MANDGRSFPNPVEGSHELQQLQIDESEFRSQLSCLKQGLLTEVLQGGKRASENDSSVYTGLSGIALLLIKLGRNAEAKELLENALQLKQRRVVTFLCGYAGPLAILASMTKAESRLDQLLAMLPSLSANDMPDELLYGRAGYLYALLYVKESFPNHGGLDATIKAVCDMIISSGQRGSKMFKSRSPLMYEWHETKYYGAAHGLVGILFMLLQAGDKYLSADVLETLVKPSIDYLVSIMYPSGNIPSSRGSEQDKLIHWCHGAPGAVHLFLIASKVFQSQPYLEAAKKCGDVIWKRGLLKKGYGLCHGVSGNAYAFLSLFQFTKEEIYLKKARVFTQFLFSYGQHGCRSPDRPYSLFEGISGTIYFLSDMENHSIAKFPCFYI